MASRLPEGAALLVAGARSLDESRLALSAVHTLGQIGETLLATGASWRIRRLSPATGERYAPDRANLKQYIDELVGPAGVAVLVIAADIATTGDGPAIVTGNRYREYPSEATLPLAWVRERLRGCQAERLLVLVSAQPRSESARASMQPLPGAWLEALGTDRATDVVAVDAGGGTRALDALLGGLCGEALDPGTGTVTMRSMSEHLARVVPGVALQSSLASATLVVSPPLGGLWAVRPSQAQRPAPRPLAPLEPDDLSGVVLPGRFRVERKLANGSFGAVYRARQLAVERDVAVKVLHANIDPASEDGRLFVHEIQSVGRIDHAHVVRIHQADITPDGRLFFAMELLVGRDLQEIVNAEGVLTRDRAVALTRQLLAGLGAAHEAGLVHADVKPANAFVASGREGERVVLLDFGLARLRPSGRPAESAGGTPAYMAPEQLHDWRVDARSDLFSAALVLVTLLTGWRRRSAEDIVPPLDGIADAGLTAVLTRALALDPSERFQNAEDFSDALAGKQPTSSQTMVSRPPFRHLAPFTERDRGRLYGRERDVADLTEYVLYRRAVIYTAPSGAGKTSLLRAGLVPHLESLGVRPVYLTCRPGAAAALAAAIRPGAASIAEAVASWHKENHKRLVLVLDQLEAVLSSDQTTESSGQGPAAGAADVVRETLALDRLPAEADVSVVLSVREDFLARVIGSSRRLDEGVPILRLGPLTKEGALAAIVGPLAEQRLTIAPDLLEVLLADLEAAARALGPEMGWGPVAAAYPPHLQLACSVLYEALGPGEATLTLAHYRRLGGFDAIVGEHLDRVLDNELDPSEAAVARDLFLTLVTGAHTRALRTEAELVDIAGSRHGADRVIEVLEALRARGLLVRLRTHGGEPSWELVHDSLLPRVLAWVDRRDLDRRRAVELVRYHVRRSQPELPSLLRRAELRELRVHPDAIDELEAEWSRRSHESPWTPAMLVARSRRVLRRRVLALSGALLLVVATLGIAIQRWLAERANRQREATLRDRDMGRFMLELVPFDWDGRTRRPVPVLIDALPSLAWQLHEAHPDHPDQPGEPIAPPLLVRGPSSPGPTRHSRLHEVESRGGSAFLVVEGRGADESCPPSIIPIRRLPGYAERERTPPHFRIRVPTCQATRDGTIAIPTGSFLFGGLGDPPSPYAAMPAALRPEQILDLPAFRIDRTEVTNAAFQVFADMVGTTGVAMPLYPASPELRGAGEPERPVVWITWTEARAYCRFLGKDLPSTEEWEKAVRGGLMLSDGSANPRPRRNLPWGSWMNPPPARLMDTGEKNAPAAPAGSFEGDVSPYGVLDLAGNVIEWTRSPSETRGYRIARGGGWETVPADDLVDYMAIHNARPEGSRFFGLGMRCVLSGE